MNAVSVASVLVVIAAAIAMAAFTYLRLERTGGRVIVPLTARAVAWAALGLLLLNVSCPRPPVARRPLVLLDGSLSMVATGGRWTEARALAARLGEVRTFGDERPPADSTPSRGRSLLAPALTAAAAADRPVVIVTDGEIEDSAALAPDLLAAATVRVLPRAPGRDVALTAVDGPARVTVGDTLRLEVELRAFGAAPDSVVIEVFAGERALSRRVMKPFRAGRLDVIVPTAGLGAGDHLLTIRLAAPGDRETRDDARLHLVTVAATPGIVLLASPGDWDSRFLYRTIRDVAELPVRGYVQLEAGAWRSMRDLARVPTADVRRAAGHADLLVLKGSAGALVPAPSARGIWHWASGETGETLLPGDWYLSAGTASPIAGAFAGEPVDSFPPAVRITPIQPAPGDWIGLTARESRRGAERPVVVGRSTGRTREVTVAADGLWRWAFRGGSSEQVYRSWVAATTSWLLAGADSARGVARPVRAIVENGRPLVFQWVAAGAPHDVIVSWTGGGTRADTLRFDGSGRAAVRLPVGSYRYRLEGGGGGSAAVELYSDEWLPARAALADHAGRLTRAPGRTTARDWPWLFAVAVLALAVEWLARRRLGLR